MFDQYNIYWFSLSITCDPGYQSLPSAFFPGGSKSSML
uniref:Uncharacterized protein n=1 Tax=Utricularia reniformis TaxID=192314 RepID=A0A1Y0B0G5_9LAMI|nr:hypothetical protein AEK19_MT0664 [Utricularia reniformis]ART30915.1 hypothetical protein AEK19_MT0664 [Utricularia reniformis]